MGLDDDRLHARLNLQSEETPLEMDAGWILAKPYRGGIDREDESWRRFSAFNLSLARLTKRWMSRIPMLSRRGIVPLRNLIFQLIDDIRRTADLDKIF